MGCDFFWWGSVPDPAVHGRTARFLAPRYDEAALVVPQPALRLPMLVEKGSRLPRLYSAYPFDFFAFIPHRSRDWNDIWEREQFVFDRTDEGRLVTVVPSASRVGALSGERRRQLGKVARPEGLAEVGSRPRTHRQVPRRVSGRC